MKIPTLSSVHLRRKLHCAYGILLAEWRGYCHITLGILLVIGFLKYFRTRNTSDVLVQVARSAAGRGRSSEGRGGRRRADACLRSRAHSPTEPTVSS